MTLKQKAHTLIDAMEDDELRAWIFLIEKRDSNIIQMRRKSREIEKQAALARLDKIAERMAPRFPSDFDPEQELITALEEKYGRVD